MRKCHDYDRKLDRLYIKADCFNCDHCAETSTFTTKQNLLRHLLDTHFSSKFNLKSVKTYESHCKTMPSSIFGCKLCSELFKRRIDLNNHIKANHKKQNHHMEICSVKTKASESKRKKDNVLENRENPNKSKVFVRVMEVFKLTGENQI